MAKKRYTSQEREARDIAVNEGGLEYVVDMVSSSEYVDVTGSKGGDHVTLRVMNDGQFYEK